MAEDSGTLSRNTPAAFNHNLMLKEIRDNLKHLRREPENANDEVKQNSGTQVVYHGNISNSHNHHVNHQQARFAHHQRNNFGHPNRVNNEQIPGNRNYDESGYSSSSSECSSQSMNDFNGHLVGNPEDAFSQSMFPPSSFDFVRAMQTNSGYERIKPSTQNAAISQMQYPTKSPPPYKYPAQKPQRGGREPQQMTTQHTKKVETSKYMAKTASPSGRTTISEAEWKVTSGPEIPLKPNATSANAKSVIPHGGAMWKKTPYSISSRNQMPPPANGSHGKYQMGGYVPQPNPPIESPQFQVQVSLNTANGLPATAPPTNFVPMVSKGPGQSATFRVSVHTSPVAMTTESSPVSRGYPGMQSGGHRRPEPAMDSPDSSAAFPPSYYARNYPRIEKSPPPYQSSSSSRTSAPPSESSQSSSQSYYDSPPGYRQTRAPTMDQWCHPKAPSVDDNMSISSDGSDSRSSSAEDVDFAGFELASMTSFDGGDEDAPNVLTNETGTLVVHVRKRPEIDVLNPEPLMNGEARSQRPHISPETYKFYMEQRVENVLKDRKEREHRRFQLEQEMQKVNLSEDAQSQMRKLLSKKESNYIRLKRSKMDPSMFRKVQVIGVGAFGEVCLTTHVQSGSFYAMKILKKSEVLKRNQVAHVKAERDILAEADNEWVVKLFYSFQDKDNLYFVMEYVQGGDLMSLLIKEGFFREEMARFYIAELVLAIESVHRMGFIHRDIKPDNVLIDSDGHIKLTDFGLCTGFRWTHDSKYYQNGTLSRNHSRNPSMDYDESWAKEHKCRCGHAMDGQKPLARRHIRQHMRCQAHSLVGTPNYIAPEVLMRIPYTHLCDWWSVGVILYEMLVGRPPFYSPNAAETQMKVINWETTLNIPRQAELTSEAEDLILKLCTSANQRLGINGVDDIKNHPFFHGIDWLMIRRTKAYHVPKIRHPGDTSNFPPIEPERPQGSECESMTELPEDGTKSKHPSHAFYEFTFRRFFTKDQGHSSVSNYSSWDGTESDEGKPPVFV